MLLVREVTKGRTDGVGEAIVGKGRLELFDKGFANMVFVVKLLKGVPLSQRAVTTNGTDVDHTIAKFDKGTPRIIKL